MNKYILDTDHVTLFQHGNDKIIKRATEAEDANIFVTTVTLEEQLQGRLAGIKLATANAKKPEILSVAYQNLRVTMVYFCNLQLLDFDDKANNCYQNLRQQKIFIGTYDLRIAAIALTNQAIVVTHNYKYFSKVPNLLLDHWSL